MGEDSRKGDDSRKGEDSILERIVERERIV